MLHISTQFSVLMQANSVLEVNPSTSSKDTKCKNTTEREYANFNQDTNSNECELQQGHKSQEHERTILTVASSTTKNRQEQVRRTLSSQRTVMCYSNDWTGKALNNLKQDNDCSEKFTNPTNEQECKKTMTINRCS